MSHSTLNPQNLTLCQTLVGIGMDWIALMELNQIKSGSHFLSTLTAISFVFIFVGFFCGFFFFPWLVYLGCWGLILIYPENEFARGRSLK